MALNLRTIFHLATLGLVATGLATAIVLHCPRLANSVTILGSTLV
jgi:hypothetical protein